MPPVKKADADTRRRSSRPAAEPAPAPEPTSEAARDEALKANLASLRDLLAGGVVLTAQRVQEAVDDAVMRGRMTRRDAEELAGALLQAGRAQTQDVLAEIEQRVGKGRSDLSNAKSITRGAVKGTSDQVLRQVDRARRGAGLGAAFPILGYDELSVAQVRTRLEELSEPELRRVRLYEEEHRGRKGVLGAIDRALDTA